MPDRRLVWFAWLVLLAGVPRAAAQVPIEAVVQAAEHADRGNALVGNGQLVRAIEAYSEAIRLNPTRGEYFLRRGLLYKMTGAPFRAAEDFTALIKLEPNNADGYYLRGTAHPLGPQLRVWDKTLPPPTNDPLHLKAISDLDEAIRLDPSMGKAYFARGAEHTETTRDYEKAVADFTAAIRLTPYGPAAAYSWWSRGWVHALLKGDHAKAVADYTQAVSLNANMPMAYASRAHSYYKLGKLKEAIADYTQAITLDPQYGFAYLRRAEIHEEMGDQRQAAADRAAGQALPQEPFAMPSRPW